MKTRSKATPPPAAATRPAARCDKWGSKPVDVPAAVALCPECRGAVQARVEGWSEGRGYTIDVSCESCDSSEEEEENHQFHQGDWQPVIDKVEAWANGPNDKSSSTRTKGGVD